ASFTLVGYAFLSWMGDGTTAMGDGRNLERVQRVVTRTQQTRLDQLQYAAQNVAWFPNLKALLGTDAPTIRGFLQDYQRRSNAPLLVALDVDGRVLAATDESDLALGSASDEL